MSTEDRGEANAHNWMDQDAGPLVRSFALTGGRASPGSESFELLTYVVTVPWSSGYSGLHLQPEHLSILEHAERPASVAEIASHLSRPLGVVRVLLNDLQEMGAITKYSPTPTANRPDDRILQAVIDGLRAAG